MKEDQNKRHGSPWDRGSADAYYGRHRDPHYYTGGTGMSPIVGKEDMTEQELREYNRGYDHQIKSGEFKYGKRPQFR